MGKNTRQRGTTDVRVALLTNSLSPHTLALCESISERVGELRAFVSAASDTFHHFPQPRASFSIVVQRSINALRLRHRTPHFSVTEELHVPVDTLPQLVRYRPDVVVSCQLGVRTLFAILHRVFHPDVRLIIWAALSTHTEGKRSAFRQALRRFMLRHADGAFVNGASGERYLRKLGFRGIVCSVPYAIDDALFRSPAYEPQENERRLLFCGRIDAAKGILRFGRVLRRWCADNPERKVVFTIVGSGPDAGALGSLPPLPNLTLTLLPRMDQKELAPHYHQADLFVFPSLMDEWGVVVNEAMAAGLPVLGSIYSQAVVELVSDGDNGWLCNPQSDSSLYDAIHRTLTTSVEELQSMSAYARCAAREITPSIVAARAVEGIAGVCGLNRTRKAAYTADVPLAGPAAVTVP